MGTSVRPMAQFSGGRVQLSDSERVFRNELECAFYVLEPFTVKIINY